MLLKVQALLVIACLCASMMTAYDPPEFLPDENPRFFPVGVFAEGKPDGSYRARWYATQLRALKEPALSEDTSSGGESVYRFTWLRAFDRGIAVRVVVHSDGTGTITTKMTNGEGGYEPGELTVNSTREISVEEVRHLLALVDAMGFWQIPTEPPPSNTITLDGAQWILEASVSGKYHVVDCSSPENGLLRELGLYLALKLGKLKASARTIY